MKSVCAVLVCVTFLSSCFSGSPSKVNASGKDTINYIQPVLGPLNAKDSLRFYNSADSFFNYVLVARGFNGAMLVAKNGHIVFEKYHGFGNLQKKDPLNEHSAFHLASVSKTFTAMATLKLVQSGKINLEDDVKKYLPSFPYDGIKIKFLLSHRSGLPNYLYFMQKLGWDVKQFSTNEDVLNYLIKYKPDLISRPGTHFTYCNTNYALLGLIIQKASGKSYANFLQENFFTPLQMNDTYVFNLTDTATAMPSYNFRGKREPLTFLDEGFGDKNIYSTPRDLLKWDQSMYNNQIFSKETLEAAFSPYSNEKAGIRNYGYGWRMNIYPKGKKIIYHNGWWHGNNTVLLRLIQDSATIIVLGNKYNRAIYDARKMANDFQFYFETDEADPNENVKETTNISDSVVKPIIKKKKLSPKKTRKKNVRK